MLHNASARHPTVAFLPSCWDHFFNSARALSWFFFCSSSMFSMCDSAIFSFGPSQRQHVPTSSLMSESCTSVTTASLGSVVVSITRTTIKWYERTFIHSATSQEIVSNRWGQKQQGFLLYVYQKGRVHIFVRKVQDFFHSFSKHGFFYQTQGYE